MRWWVKDGAATVELSTESTPPDGEVDALGERELEDVIGRVGSDLLGMSTLRRIYVDVVARGGSASISDFVVLGELIDAVQGGRLVGWASRPVRIAVESPREIEVAALSDLTDLASRQGPVEAVVVPVSAAVLHQVDILQRAAALGVPFCEECECEE